jgi:hypothetical protein
MILVDVGVHLEHVQVIRSKIGPELVEKYRDVQNEPISGNFRKKSKGIATGLFLKHRYIFLRLKTEVSRHFINIVYSID